MFIYCSDNKTVFEIDGEDFSRIFPYKWYFHNDGYIVGYRHGFHNNKLVRLHRLLLDAKNGEFVDHADNNKLNNKRSNLRICTKSQNQFNRGPYKTNTTGHKGIQFSKRERDKKRPWKVKFNVNYREYYVGCFETKEQAISAYNEAIKPHHGDFAWRTK